MKRSFDIALIPLLLSQSSWMRCLSWLLELFKVTLDTVEHNKHSRDHFHMHFVWLTVVVSYSFWSAFVFFSSCEWEYNRIFCTVEQRVMSQGYSSTHYHCSRVFHSDSMNVFLDSQKELRKCRGGVWVVALLSKGLKTFSAGLSMDF